MTDQCVSPTVEPYGVLGEVGELVMAAVDVLGVIDSCLEYADESNTLRLDFLERTELRKSGTGKRGSEACHQWNSRLTACVGRDTSPSDDHDVSLSAELFPQEAQAFS